MGSASSFRSPLCLCTIALLAVGARAAAAQARPDSRRCDGRVVHEIRVSALRPPFTGEAQYWHRFAHGLGLHHATTDTAVIRRFLAVESGGICTEFRLRESARLLREEPFLADARVRSVPDESGGVRVEVETVDEIPALFTASLSHGRPSYVEIGNENMFGDAWLFAVHGSSDRVTGQSAGFRASDYQFLSRPYQLDVQGDFGNRSSGWLLAASHAYLTDLQIIAWEAGLGGLNQQFIDLRRGDDINDLALTFRRFAGDVGGVLKLGTTRTPILIGGAFTYLSRNPTGSFNVTNSGIEADTTLSTFYPAQTYTRLTGIGAWRNLNFVTVRGFSSLTATEDVPTGFQIFGQLGRGVRLFHGASDIFTLTDVLSGVGSAVTYAGLHVINEARHQIGAPQWDGIITSGRLGMYWKPNDPNLVRSWVEFAGGWRVLFPFQLDLATENQRLIGYQGSAVGGRRVAGGIEARHVFTGIASKFDIGAGAFINAARLWEGDAPFGTNTPLATSAGVSLFGAFPRGSQRLLRIDVGAPLRSRIVRSGWEFRFQFTDATRLNRIEPRDVASAREQLVGPDVFRP